MALNILFSEILRKCHSTAKRKLPLVLTPSWQIRSPLLDGIDIECLRSKNTLTIPL